MLAVAGMSVNAGNANLKTMHHSVRSLSVMPMASKSSQVASAKIQQNVVASKGSLNIVRANDGTLKRIVNIASDKINTSRFVKPVVVAAENSTLFPDFVNAYPKIHP